MKLNEEVTKMGGKNLYYRDKLLENKSEHAYLAAK